MELRACKNCKRLYNHFSGETLCPTCNSQLDEIYREVKRYIYDNPNTTIQEVAETFNITIQTLHRWIREERLEFASSSLVGLPCQGCGTTIKSGRYCESCKKSMIEGFSAAYESDQPKVQKEQKTSNNRMRFIK